MKVHVCVLDRDCRSVGAPPRLHLNDMFGWSAIVALWPSGTSQEWRPSTGYTKRWRWVTVHPSRDRLCVHNGGPSCGKLVGHKGEHAPELWPRTPK